MDTRTHYETVRYIDNNISIIVVNDRLVILNKLVYFMNWDAYYGPKCNQCILRNFPLNSSGSLCTDFNISMRLCNIAFFKSHLVEICDSKYESFPRNRPRFSRIINMSLYDSLLVGRRYRKFNNDKYSKN